jgi:hypothetical protein
LPIRVSRLGVYVKMSSSLIWKFLAALVGSLGAYLLAIVVTACFAGDLRLVSRSTNVVVSFDSSPYAFALGILMYTLAAGVILWLAIRVFRSE